jgi:hypothetical protein
MLKSGEAAAKSLGLWCAWCGGSAAVMLIARVSLLATQALPEAIWQNCGVQAEKGRVERWKSW